jgi:hypothetical protein
MNNMEQLKAGLPGAYVLEPRLGAFLAALFTTSSG